MAKQVISPEHFIAEVNKRLPNHPAYKSNWCVFLHPEGSKGTTAGGYGIEPREDIGYINEVVDHV